MTGLLLGLALSASASAGAAAPERVPLAVQARAQPESIHLGEPFVYELVLTHGKGQRYELKAPGDLGAFEVLGQSRSRLDGPDSATTTFSVRMSLFELGKKTLPDLTFDVVDEQGEGKWIAKGQVEVEVVSGLPADAEQKGEDLYDIKPNEGVPVRTFRLLWALLALLAAAALGYGVYRFLKRPRAAVTAPAPPLPLHARTFAALDALRSQDLPGKGRQREFYFALSEILRGYLGERYGFEALECTSSELLEALRKLHTPGLPTEQLNAFVLESDLVKFAKAPATAEQCKGAMELGYRLVSLTLPQPAVPAAAAPPPAGPPSHAQRA